MVRLSPVPTATTSSSTTSASSISSNSVWNDQRYHHRYHFEPCRTRSSSSCFSSVSDVGDEENTQQPYISATSNSKKMNRIEELTSTFTLWTPLWTIVASGLAVWKAPLCSTTLGSLGVMQSSYWALMMTMGLAISKTDLDNLQQTSPWILLWNALLCFGAMPLLAVGISRVFQLTHNHTTGLVLLGCVGGGQASNLFSLLAGGNVALSVLCTVSTTLLGVLVTPLLLEKLLLLGGGYYAAQSATMFVATLKSIASLVLLPILVGSTLSRSFPKSIQKFSNFLPVAGVMATLLLVMGGSSNSILATNASIVATATASSISWSTTAGLLLPSCGLGILGGMTALGVANAFRLDDPTKKTLVVETLSKSPTLAYLLALKHFGMQSALVPGGAMVTLAVLGALVASVWSKLGSSNSISATNNSEESTINHPVSTTTSTSRSSTTSTNRNNLNP